MCDLRVLLLSEPPASVPILPATDVPGFYWLLEHLEGIRARWRVALGSNHDEIEPTVLETDAGVILAGIEQGVFTLRQDDGAVLHQVTDTTCVGPLDRLSNGGVLVTSDPR